MVQVRVTKNYRLFTLANNRPLELRRHRHLSESMKQYGFLPCYPIVCYRGKDKKLYVKDGQHRLTFAEKLGLSVYWIEEMADFDVAQINNTQKTWCVEDYARSFAARGEKVYEEIIAFSEGYKIPISLAACLLAGTAGFTNIKPAFVKGSFKIKDRAWGDAVATMYTLSVAISTRLKNRHFVSACMAVCRVPEFDVSRLLQGMNQCRDKLQSFSTKEAYLGMLEEVYNFRRRSLVALKIEAEKVMRERNPGIPKKAKVKK